MNLQLLDPVRITVVQNSPDVTLDTFADLLGPDVRLVRPFAGDALPDPTDIGDGLVVLGGEMSAYADDVAPWLPALRALLSAAVISAVPTLGICLGAQLLAVATGGGVKVGEDGPEVGPYLVGKRDTGSSDPLFGELPLMPDVLHFHSDVVDPLPPDSVLLASATRYPNQAFRVGRAAYGLQFHIETTTDTVLAWARDDPDTAEFASPGALDVERLDQLHADIEETWRPVITKFVQLAAGDLAPAPPPQLRLLGH